ncbi:MAG: T9SS type A sorting domain-containing protein [Bacteroidota bacterium]
MFTGPGWGGLHFEPGSGGTLSGGTIRGVAVSQDCSGPTCVFSSGRSVFIDNASPVFKDGIVITDPVPSALEVVHGVFVRGAQSTPRFESTATIRDHTGDGVVLGASASAIFRNAEILDNGDDGLAVGYNSTAYLRETLIQNNDDEGVIATAGGEAVFGVFEAQPGGLVDLGDGYNTVRENGGTGLLAATNSTVEAGYAGATRYNSILSNGGKAAAFGSSAVTYADLDYWGGGDPGTLPSGNGGQTYITRYCTQVPVVDQGCPSAPVSGGSLRTGGGVQHGVTAQSQTALHGATMQGREGSGAALDALVAAMALGAEGDPRASYDAFRSLIARYPSDPSAGAAFGEIARLLRVEQMPEAQGFLRTEAESEETLHRLWAREALARGYDALTQTEKALAAATSLDAEVARLEGALDTAQVLDWQIAGGVVRYYVLRRAAREAEAAAELAVLRTLAPEHEVVQMMLDEAGEPGLAPGARMQAGASATVQRTSEETEALGAVYPNPAGGAVTVPVTLAESTEVTVVVYDVLGRAVATVARERVEAGAHAFGLDTGTLAPGVYVVRLDAGSTTATQRFTVVR